MRNYMIIFILSIFFSGCSFLEFNENKVNLTNSFEYEKNINLTGEILIYENGELKIVIQNNKKLKLENCNSKYNILFGEINTLDGFVYKNNNEENIFYCGDYFKIKNNTEKKFQELKDEVFELNKTRNELNESITSEKSTLNRIKKDILNLADNKTIDDIEDDLKQKIISSFSNSPKISDVKKFSFYNSEPKTTKECIKKNYKNECVTFEYTDTYFKNSMINKSYNVYFYGIRISDNDYYTNFSVEAKLNTE